MSNRTRIAALVVLAALGCKSGPSGTTSTPAGGGAGTGGTTGTQTGGTGDGAGTGGAPATGVSGGKLEEVTTVEGITEYRLPNGLKVLLFPDDSKSTVTVNMTYFVGSRHEGYGETGMAHLLEHMTFKGSPKYPDTWGTLEQHGASFNGTTWYDRTNYFETLPAGDENLEFALDLEADRMVNSTIDPAQLAKEFTVVRNEFEMGENEPTSILSERMWSTAFLWHNYGKSTIGSRADIERVPVENLRAFYRKFYQPDNAMLVVAGQFDVEKAKALIEKLYAPIPRPTRKLTPTYTVEPVQDGERVVTLRRNGDVAVVGVLYHTVAGSDPEFVATEALEHALTNEPSGRLYKALVLPSKGNKEGLATDVWGTAMPFAEPGVLEVYARVKLEKDPAATEKKLQQVRDVMISVVEGAAKEMITDEEVKRYRTRTLKDLKLAFTRSDRIAVELSEWASQGDWRLIFVYRDRVEKITAAQVAEAASKYLKKDNRTVGMFIPTKNADRAPLKEAPDVTAMVQDYKGRKGAAEGEKFEYTPDNIEARTKRFALANGMKVAFLAKETRGDAVRVNMTLRYGSEKDLAPLVAANDVLSDMLMRGTSKRTYQEVKDELDRLEAQVNVASQEPGELSVGITTTRDNVVEVLALVAEILRTPGLPADQLELVRKEGIAALEQQLADPNQQAFITVLRKLRPVAPRDVRYIPTTQESIDRLKGVTIADVKKVHALLGASNATIALVGDFDADEAKGALEASFGGWKSPKPYKRIENRYLETKADATTIDTPDKEMALILSAQALELRDTDPEYAAFDMTNYLVGGSLGSRLFTRLRQKEGLSYGPFSFFVADSEDRYGLFAGGAIIAPQNAEKGMAVLVEELEKIVASGVTAEELATAQKSYKGEFDNRFTNDSYIAQILNQGLHLDRKLDYYKNLLAAVLALEPDDVNATVKKFLKPGAHVRIIAGDMKKAKAAQTPPAPAK